MTRGALFREDGRLEKEAGPRIKSRVTVLFLREFRCFLANVPHRARYRNAAALPAAFRSGISFVMRDERQYVFDMIGAFLSGPRDKWDWDFQYFSLANPVLDQMRRRAISVKLPLDADVVDSLKALLDEVEAFTDPARPKPWRMETGFMFGLLVGVALWWWRFLPGGGVFQNLHMLLIPAALGVLVVASRNRKKSVGFHDPEIIARNKRGRA